MTYASEIEAFYKQDGLDVTAKIYHMIDTVELSLSYYVNDKKKFANKVFLAATVSLPFERFTQYLPDLHK